MKRLLFFAALVLAIGSYGGHIGTAHAQTLTPSQTAALQQQLDVAKATLSNTGDSGTATVVTPATSVATQSTTVVTQTTGFSANDIAAFQNTLTALTATLSQLNASLSINNTLTPSQTAAVETTLNGMQGTLVAMADEINGANNTVATTIAPTPVVISSAPSQTLSANNPSAPAATTPIVTAAATAPATDQPAINLPQTAQASTFWSFTKAHWPTIVIILIVIAILAILFWPEKEKVRTVSTTPSASGKPKSAPTSNASLSGETVSVAPAQATHSVPAPATPVANAVAAPAQR